MPAMSRTAVDFELRKQKQSKPWGLKISEKNPCASEAERYVPTKLCRAISLPVWSRFVCRPWSDIQEQQDHIPLTWIDLTPDLDADSEFSAYTSTQCSFITSKTSNRNTEPIVFNFHFGDDTFVKELDYATFARWESVGTLLEGFEVEGAVIDELWDVREGMRIWSGDWEARVYPGIEVDAKCREPCDRQIQCSSDDSDDETFEEWPRHTNESGLRHWWFGRWRMKVEQETMGIGGGGRDPSRRTVLLGAMVMLAFLGIVSILCSL